MSKTTKTTFEGFDIPNTTPVPDIVFDELLGELTGNELKVLLYIIRRTYGFGKNADAISLSQFRKGITTQDGKVLDKGCGIEHNRTIIAALTSLVKKGYVIARKRQTNAGDSDTTIYKLRFKNAEKVASKDSSGGEVVTPGNEVVTSSNDGSYSTSPRWLPQVTTVVTPGNQQETVLQYTDSQETDSQEVTSSAASVPSEQSDAAIADRTPAPSSPNDQQFINALLTEPETVPTAQSTETILPTVPQTPPPEHIADSGNMVPKQAANNSYSQQKADERSYRQVGKNGVTSLTFDELVQAQREAKIRMEQEQAPASKQATSDSQEHTRNGAPQEEKPKRSRAKKPKIDDALQKRIDHVYEFFNKLALEVSGKVDHYKTYDKGTNAIIEWLKGNPTEELLQEVYIELWNTPPDKRTGFSWRKNMRIHSVLGEYDNRVLDIMARRNGKRTTKTAAELSAVLGYQVEDEPVEELEFVGVEQLRRRHQRGV